MKRLAIAIPFMCFSLAFIMSFNSQAAEADSCMRLRELKQTQEQIDRCQSSNWSTCLSERQSLSSVYLRAAASEVAQDGKKAKAVSAEATTPEACTAEVSKIESSILKSYRATGITVSCDANSLTLNQMKKVPQIRKLVIPLPNDPFKLSKVEGIAPSQFLFVMDAASCCQRMKTPNSSWTSPSTGWCEKEFRIGKQVSQGSAGTQNPTPDGRP